MMEWTVTLQYFERRRLFFFVRPAFKWTLLIKTHLGEAEWVGVQSTVNASTLAAIAKLDEYIEAQALPEGWMKLICEEE